METMDYVFCAGLVIVAILAVGFWISWKKSQPSLASRIIISYSKTGQMMENEGFEERASFPFDFSSEKNRPSDRKIKEAALRSLVRILQKSAKEILNTYSVVILVENREIIHPNKMLRFSIKVIAWIKKKPNGKEERPDGPVPRYKDFFPASPPDVL